MDDTVAAAVGAAEIGGKGTDQDYSGAAEVLKDIKFEDDTATQEAEPEPEKKDVKPEPEKKEEPVKTPDAPKVRIGDAEYVLDEDTVKLFGEALESHKNFRELRATATNHVRDAATARAQAKEFIDFVKSLGGDNAEMLRDGILQTYGEKTAAKFDELLKLDPAEIKHPAEEELERQKHEAAVAEGEKKVRIQRAALKANVKYGLTDADLDTIWAEVEREYATDPEKFKLNIEATFRRMPLYEEKIKSVAEKELKEKLAKEEAERRGKPPVKSSGAGGGEKQPQRYEDIKIDPKLFKT